MQVPVCPVWTVINSYWSRPVLSVQSLLETNQHLAESYGGQPEGPGTGVQTRLGLRKHDVNYIPIGKNGSMAVEGKNYLPFRFIRGRGNVRNFVPLSAEIRQQVYKDVLWMREGRKLGEVRLAQWEFGGAPPSEALGNFLTDWGIPYVVTLNVGRIPVP